MSRSGSLLRRVLAVVISLSVVTTLSPVPAAAAADIVINEVRIDQPGDDNDEYFELAGEAGTALDGLTYLVIGDGAAGSGVIEAVIGLGGASLPASGFFVAAETTFSLGTAVLTTDLNFENSDNVTHLLVDGFTGTDGDDLDTDDDGTLDVTPWTEIVDSVALIETVGSGDHVYSSATVGPDGSFVPGHVFRCGETWNIGAFDPVGGDDTPGAANDCGLPPGPELSFIHEVQGSGASSPMVGEEVTVEAVVVGDFQGSAALRGFFLQEEDSDADADPDTSEGVFVFDGSSPTVGVAVGDQVRVTGTVQEFFGLTQIGSVTEVAVIASGVALPTANALAFPLTDAEREAVEGMRVTLTEMYVTDTFNLHRFGEVWLADGGVIDQPTNELPPGSAMEALAAENILRSILLDDGTNASDPSPIPYLHANGTLRLGDRADEITAVMSFGFGSYRLQPVEAVDFVEVNVRPIAPGFAGNLTVATFNVLNYWTTLGGRGAATAAQLEVQTEKLVAAINGMGADIVALQEIENPAAAHPRNPFDPAHTPIRTLVAALNDAAGGNEWAWVGPADHYNDYPVRNEIIYRVHSVSQVGAPIALADPAFDADNPEGEPFGRPPLAQTFQARGAVFTLVVNHLKSKGSPCLEPDEGADGQANCNLKRVEQAAALLDFVADLQVRDRDVLVVGDLNSYMEEDPIHTLETELTNLVTAYDADPYSFNFFAIASAPFIGRGSLDHALATPTMAGQVTGAAIWHVNADEPRFLDWFNPALSGPGAFRSSDHDPLLIGLALEIGRGRPGPP